MRPRETGRGRAEAMLTAPVARSHTAHRSSTSSDGHRSAGSYVRLDADWPRRRESDAKTGTI
ncbi:hypothetical protein SMF913_25834 [Streptomyces malaysiensis]|uniref:Uncharacterized protein n=1 Tax=Streptomyces malaysiensis TaxID=92644 RepID=A0A2J7YR28_STRMQ|nr:hypothetical protein SMF913_25834 [Streptomyces malaysiensis]